MWRFMRRFGEWNLRPDVRFVGSFARWLTIFVFAYVYLSQFKGAMIDDAYITLQYARTLRDSLTWGFYAGYPANTATSPLNVWLLSVAGLLIHDMPTAVVFLSSIESVALIALLGRLSVYTGGRIFSFGAALALLGNPLIISTLGLESLLFAVLLVAAVYCFVYRRSILLALTLACLVLTRPDGVLAALVFIPLYGRGWWRPAILYLVALAPWCLFAWIFLGGVAPDTLLLKISQRSWGGWTFATGPVLYAKAYPAETLTAFALIPFASLMPLVKDQKVRRLSRSLILYALLFYAVYSWLGVPPYHWYYAPVIVAFTLAAVLGLMSLRLPRFSGALLFPVLIPVLGLLNYLFQSGIPPTEMPIHTNWAQAIRYAEIGEWLRKNLPDTARIRLTGEIGTVSYYAERYLFDEFSCRHEQLPMLRYITANDRLFAKVLSFNYQWWEPGPPCGPYSHYLIMIPRASYTVPADGEILAHWVIHSRWVRDGHVLLVQNSRSTTVSAAGPSRRNEGLAGEHAESSGEKDAF